MLRVDALRAERAAASGQRVRAGDDAGLRAVGHVGVGDRLVHDEEAPRSEEPQLIFGDRPAHREVGVVVGADLVDRLHAVRREEGRQVVALHLAGLVPLEQRAAEAVAALFRDHVDLHAAGRRVDRAAAGLVDHFLVAGVVGVGLNRAVTLQTVDDHPVHHQRGLRRAEAVDGEVGLLHRLRAADVRRRQRDADDELSDALNRVGGRHRVEHVARQHLRLRVALDVDDGRLAGHGDRLLHRADFQVGVDRGREIGRQLDAVALHRREAGQVEGDRVSAGTEVLNAVQPVGVRGDRPHLLDQGGAAGFHRHARQHGARRILHNTCKRTLRARGRGKREASQRHGEQHRKSTSRHPIPPQSTVPDRDLTRVEDSVDAR